MHYLVPLVSHTVSCLYALVGKSITPAAVVISAVLVAAQSYHHWGGFYFIFAVFFLTTNGINIALRNYGTSKIAPRTTASYVLANVFLAAALVPGHYLFMEHRKQYVKWFLKDQAPGGCLPLPSPTIYEPYWYSFWDSCANQLPWGVVASYTVAMANTFSASTGNPTGLSTGSIVGAALGSLLIAATAASVLPMCDGELDAAHQVMETIDRSVAWTERRTMIWTDQQRYQIFVGVVTLVGTFAVVIQRLATQALRGSMTTAQKSKQANGHVKDGKKVSKVVEQVESNGGKDLTSFLTNILATTGVVLGMAAWTYVGARTRPEDVPGRDSISDIVGGNPRAN